MGKSLALASLMLCHRDYPRVCGEKRKTGAVPAPLPGSPPRVRGKEIQQPQGAPRPGITPAYAGKSLTIQNLTTGSRDHPRVCGEKDQIQQDAARTPGSPPRMRGKAWVKDFYKLEKGITPACAGKSLFCFTAAVPIQDHPRVCGEKFLAVYGATALSGSPPRVRGKADEGFLVLRHHGITPAYAGKSALRAGCHPSRWDHPRVCGEKLQDIS